MSEQSWMRQKIAEGKISSSVEETDPVVILRRAYYHVALKCIPPCSHAEPFSQRCLKDKSAYPLTMRELRDIEKAFCGFITLASQNTQDANPTH